MKSEGKGLSAEVGMGEPRVGAEIGARRATVGDVPGLVGLMREFHEEAGYALDPGLATKGFSTLLGDSRLGATWVLLDRGLPAGFVTMTVRFSMECFGMDAFVDDLFVRPGHRRRGLGKRALEAVIEECERRGIAALNVVVGADNQAARALYGSFGLAPATDGRETLSARFGKGT